jgi:hypothetical protein
MAAPPQARHIIGLPVEVQLQTSGYFLELPTLSELALREWFRAWSTNQRGQAPCTRRSLRMFCRTSRAEWLRLFFSTMTVDAMPLASCKDQTFASNTSEHFETNLLFRLGPAITAKVKSIKIGNTGLSYGFESLPKFMAILRRFVYSNSL